jgi:hypothetical protein
MPTKHEALIKRLDKSRDILEKSLDGLDEAQCCSEIVSGEWTIKDILGHLVSFGDVFREVIKVIREQDIQMYDYVIGTEDGFTKWNLKHAATKKDWNWKRILGDIDRDYLEMFALINGMSVEGLAKRGIVPWKLKEGAPKPQKISPSNSTTIDAVIKIHTHHFEHHATIIQAWRKAMQTG